MEFRIHCECGSQIIVSQGSAGATIPCACGRRIAVPSLGKLRLQAGLPEIDVGPEHEIPILMKSGQLPPGRNCVVCGMETENVAHVIAECERTYRKGGGFNWGLLFLSIVFLPIRIFHRDQEVEYGRDTVLQLPLPLCGDCRRSLRRPRAIKAALRRVEIYSRLLEKFPDARVALSE